jgi:hypothetical protein
MHVIEDTRYIYRKDGHDLEMMTPGNKTQIVAGMDRPMENNQKQSKSVSRFRQVLPQVSNYTYLVPRLAEKQTSRILTSTAVVPYLKMYLFVICITLSLAAQTTQCRMIG